MSLQEVGAGLVAAALVGIAAPQVGIENHTTLEAVRVDRFAPARSSSYVACFVRTLALVAACSASRVEAEVAARGDALDAGAALGAAACAKAPGAPHRPGGVCVVPLVGPRSPGGVSLIRSGRGACALVAAAHGAPSA